MTAPLINGYLVVSAPSERLSYRGVDREPWEAIDEAFYARTLPLDIRREYEVMHDECEFWWPALRSRRQAERLLAYTRQHEPSAELIGVLSPYLANMLGYEAWPDSTATWIGIDIISIGEWSLLRALQEASVSLPGDEVALNEAYLLRSDAEASRVEQHYRRLAAENRVEPIADPDALGTEAVVIYTLGEYRGD
jgi:hypothetical protein